MRFTKKQETRNGLKGLKMTQKFYNNLFDGLLDDLTPAFESVQKTISAAKETAQNCTTPMNVFKEEDGSYGVEVAVVGKKKEDIKLSAKNENGKTALLIETVEPETDTAEDKRQYSVKKIKAGKMNISILLPSNLDFAKLTAKVEDGLLSIAIPVKEAEKPLTFEIQ